ncbi:MAG TPA: response regulator [Actinomycetota bacterium]|nr:response regulator [Actinomycetota bacterium]
MDESGSSLGPPRPVVLVAEDDPSVRFTIELVLEGEGFDVVLAEDGQRALDMAFTKSPDAILLDLTMPKLDGQQVLRRLREAEHTARIPVFVLSGRVRDPNDVWDGAHFVGKPFDPDSLVESIRTALQA